MDAPAKGATEPDGNEIAQMNADARGWPDGRFALLPAIQV
jgi:hypothetical protein